MSKAIQIAVTGQTKEVWPCLFVLYDNGTIWRGRLDPTKPELIWEHIKEPKK